MASNAYRYDDARRGTQGKSRVGLAGVGTGNGGAAPYQLAALQPGSRGFWASSFGAPATGETPDRPLPAAPTPEPAPQPTAAPATASGPPWGDASFNQSLGEGAGAGGGNTGGREGFDAGGKPGDMGDLGLDIDGKTIGGALGGVAGGLLAGPLGALAGGVAGRAIGGALSGPSNDGMATGPELAGLNAQAEQNAANMAGAMGGPGGFGDARGLAKGGPVKPGNLHRQIPPKKGLAGVGAEPGFMGGFADGGRVGGMPHYMDGGPVDALAGPDPAGPDDGFAALDQGEFVVRQDQAQRPDYAPILEQMNAGTYDPDGDADMGAGSGAGMSVPSQLPDAGTGSRVAAMDPMERQTLIQAVSQDPMLAEALTALIGPEGMSLLMSAPVGPEGVDSAAMLASRAPMAGPPPVPGAAVPPGFPPPAQQRGGLASVVNG